METVYGHGAIFKIHQEKDGWWSIYRCNDVTFELEPLIQAKDREHALSYINMVEVPNIPLQRI